MKMPFNLIHSNPGEPRQRANNINDIKWLKSAQTKTSPLTSIPTFDSQTTQIRRQKIEKSSSCEREKKIPFEIQLVTD